MYSDEHYAGRRPGAAAPFPQDPLRTVGGVALAGLVFAMAAGLWEIVRLGTDRSIIDRIIAGDTSVTEAQANSADSALNAASNVETAVLILTAIGFASWFWRVRRVAGEYDPHGQRRSQGWAFWGWVCPIVNFWFPFQIASDALHSTPGPTARPTVVLRAWWLFYLLTLLMNRVVARHDPHTAADFKSFINLETTAVCLQIIAGAFAIAVVVRLTSRLDRYGDQLRRSYAPR